jgi:hypothetical protein
MYVIIPSCKTKNKSPHANRPRFPPPNKSRPFKPETSKKSGTWCFRLLPNEVPESLADDRRVELLCRLADQGFRGKTEMPTPGVSTEDAEFTGV